MRGRTGLCALAACLALSGTAIAPAAARAVTLPTGFEEEVAFDGLTEPTAVEFAPDGRVFVAEKSGLIKVFSGPGDDTAAVVADLRTEVHNFWDRGLLDIALDPEFASDPHVYALYTHDAEIGGAAPRWGSPDATSDPCPDPPGANDDGCVVSGRLSRLPLNGNSAGPEQVLIEDWCQQYPSHAPGSIAFDESGALYASGGDGASFTFADYGQRGDPLNPCGDPPVEVGETQSPPGAEGGALRSQDLRTESDPAGLAGTVIRVDPTDGSALPDNPNADSGDANVRRVIGYGLRNPFRFAIRPGTSELWIGDVGWRTWEEINRLEFTSPENFGWPCEEGPDHQGDYDNRDLTICEDLYADSDATAPFFTYQHDEQVVDGESCSTSRSSISGLAFYESGPFPDSYDGALFFADYSRDCIWALRSDAQGIPDPATIETFGADASGPVNLHVGEDGALYYPDLDGGAIRAIRYTAPDPPTIADTNPDSPANDNAPEVVGVAEAGSTVRLYESDDCTGPIEDEDSAAAFAFSGLTADVADDRTVSFTATATDGDGDVSSCSAPFEYTEDSTSPDTWIVSGPSGRTGDPTPTFAFSSTEAGSSFRCRFDSAPFAACSGPGARHTPSAELDDGAHTFQVRATDRAGNADPSPQSRGIVVDTSGDPPPYSAKGKMKPGGTVVLNVGCEVDCTVTAKGKVVLRRPSPRGATAEATGRRVTIRLKRAAAELTAGQGAKLKLKPKPRSARRKLKRLVSLGYRTNARITITVADRAHNTTSRKLSLRPGK